MFEIFERRFGREFSAVEVKRAVFRRSDPEPLIVRSERSNVQNFRRIICERRETGVFEPRQTLPENAQKDAVLKALNRADAAGWRLFFGFVRRAFRRFRRWFTRFVGN